MKRAGLAAAALLLHAACLAATPSRDAALRLAPLAERVAKLSAQSGQGILAQRSRRALADTVRDFDAALRDVRAGAHDGAIRENYVLLALLWQEYRDWGLRPGTRETARKLRERAEEVEWIADKGVRLMRERSHAEDDAMALRAAQAFLLAQRIPKSYLWRRWDIRDAELDRELRDARENLGRVLDALAQSPGLDAESAADVETARTQWKFLLDAATQLDAAPANATALEFACKAADHIAESMDRVLRRAEPAR